ncbi:MAG: insulinase family protein [Verrucomicrobiae bacterium]|jgi:predicted Zn-dependent peptidase|nr:insulinase family protein [Verrucomicrobiae bacterium]
MNQQTTRLKNGLQVVSVRMPHAASVCLGVWCGVGSRHEQSAENGTAHFIEHLLFKGTGKRDAKAIVADVEGIGGYLNAYTSEDHTCYYARARADRWRVLLDVLLDMYCGASIPAVEVRREREVIKEERAMYLDDPHHVGLEVLGCAMWPDHPLGRPIEGTDTSLDGLRRAALTRFWKKHYTAANTCVVAAGNLSHSALVSATRLATNGMAIGEPAFCEAAVHRQTGPVVAVEHKDVDQTQVALGIRTAGRDDPRRFALRLLNAVLAENMSSRLYQVLRERHGLAYSVSSCVNTFSDTGDVTITAGVDSERLPKALELLRSELRRLSDRGIDEGELRQARDYVVGQFDLHLEGTENYMTWLGEGLMSTGTTASPTALKQRIRRVTVEQVNAVARDFLRSERMTMALVTPRKGDRDLERYLRL